MIDLWEWKFWQYSAYDYSLCTLKKSTDACQILFYYCFIYCYFIYNYSFILIQGHCERHIALSGASGAARKSFWVLNILRWARKRDVPCLCSILFLLVLFIKDETDLHFITLFYGLVFQVCNTLLYTAQMILLDVYLLTCDQSLILIKYFPLWCFFLISSLLLLLTVFYKDDVLCFLYPIFVATP